MLHRVVRDAVPLADPVGSKALGTDSRTSRRAAEGEVVVGSSGVAFTPGEWVFSDEDGILVLSPQQATG